MSRPKRFLFQIILWGIIWLLLWMAQNFEFPFLMGNIPVYIVQLGAVAILIYYLGPKLFEEKKYGQFLLLSLLIIGVGSIVTSFLQFNGPPPPPPPHLEGRPAGLKPPIINHLSQELFLSLAYLLGLFIEGMHFLQKKEQEATVIKNEALQSELKLLKSQINPHFLFNTLNNIYALAGIDADKTQLSISYLSDMLRYVLYDCDRPFVFPEKEVQYIENYIRLFSLKNSKKYPIEIASHILDPAVQIAPMLLIPFVENAIKHSYIEKLEDAFIHIVLKVSKESIWFQIENSVPNEAFNKDQTGGIGLKNVKQRLAIIYPTTHQLVVDQKENSFKIELTIKTL